MRRTWSKNIRTSFHPLDPASDPPDIDNGQYSYQSDDPADGTTRYHQGMHRGRLTCGVDGVSMWTIVAHWRAVKQVARVGVVARGDRVSSYQTGVTQV